MPYSAEWCGRRQDQIYTSNIHHTHTHKFIYTTAAAISTSQQHFEGCGTFTHTDTHRDTACPHDCLSKRISLSDGWGGNKLAEKRDNLLSFTLPNDFLKSVSLPWQLTLHFFLSLFIYLFLLCVNSAKILLKRLMALSLAQICCHMLPFPPASPHFRRYSPARPPKSRRFIKPSWREWHGQLLTNYSFTEWQ